MRPRAGSHGDANGEFTLAAGGADEQQVCHVGASDEEDETDGSKEDEERGAHVADDAVAQGFNGEAFLWFHRALGDSGGETGRQRVSVGVRLGQSYARLEASGSQERSGPGWCCWVRSGRVARCRLRDRRRRIARGRRRWCTVRCRAKARCRRCWDCRQTCAARVHS